MQPRAIWQELRTARAYGPREASTYRLCYIVRMAKLTLSIDDRVIARAKKFAAKRETSVSELVERYLDLISAPSRKVAATPTLGRLRGALAGVDPGSRRAELERKYR